jgi:hypothetical protein
MFTNVIREKKFKKKNFKSVTNSGMECPAKNAERNTPIFENSSLTIMDS